MKKSRLSLLGCALLLLQVLAQIAHGQTRPRARDVGVPFEGVTGPLNALTDVQPLGPVTELFSAPRRPRNHGADTRKRAKPNCNWLCFANFIFFRNSTFSSCWQCC